MIIDASAIVAIALNETTAEELLTAIVDSGSPRISASSFLEACIVIDSRRNPAAGRRLDDLVRTADIQVVAFTADQARIARQAYRDYGRGSGHAANLNFGDCFSYALAAAEREPLLFVGDDFGHTDIRSALPS